MNQPNLLLKNVQRFLSITIVGALLFNAIFWQEKIALNLLLFVAFSIAALISLYKETFKDAQAKLLLLATIASMIMVIIYNSTVSCLACFSAFILLTAYCKYKQRSPVYAAASAMESFLYFIPQFFTDLKKYFTHKKSGKSFSTKIRLAIIPGALVFVFFFIYIQSSQAFSQIVSKFSNQILVWIEPVINWIAPERIGFIAFGLCITGGLLFRSYQKSFEQQEALKKDVLQRAKSNRKRDVSLWQELMQLFIGRRAIGPLGLMYEYKAGVLSFVVLNLLLLFVNATDVVYLWVSRQYDANFAWSEYVHEGAEMLILSIVLAMLVVLFFFRGNLNFFKGKKWLLRLAYIWIIQNLFLAASAALRNYHYIMHCGLTYKRIGVCVFVLLVAVGLVSVYVKIRTVKSTYYLVKFNAFAGLATFIIATFFQWDVMIARYNIENRNTILLDADFLLTLSDHALPVLQQHAELFSKKKFITRQEYVAEDDNGNDITVLDYRIRNFLAEQKSYSWLSWNIADAQTTRQLQQARSLAQSK
jgi:hypothetical protein